MVDPTEPTNLFARPKSIRQTRVRVPDKPRSLARMDYLDTSTVALSLAEKVANLRIFDDDRGKMKRSPLDVKGSALVGSYAFPYWTNQIST